MVRYNANNERIKRAYFEWQKEANQKSQSTIENMRKSITKYEVYTNYQDFKSFNKHKAVAFKKHFAKAKSVQSNEFLSKATMLSTIRNLKDFFKWLAYQKGYKKIDIREIEYLNLSEKEIIIAQAKKRQKVPSLEQIKKVINLMRYD